MKTDCERSWELDALREGRLAEKDADAFERHLRGCAICTHEKAFAEKARELAKLVPAKHPPELQLRRIRARVLRAAELGVPATRRKMAPWAIAIAAVAAAVALGISVRRSSSKPATMAASASPASIEPSSATIAEPLTGSVQASGGAKWRQTRIGNIERVTLEDGALRIHVRHQSLGERFFVDTPDGVIEVRGTTFEVETFEGHTTRVAVDEGFVSWRMTGASEVLLHAGDSWKPHVPALVRATTPPPNAHLAPATATADDGSETYAAAVILLNDGEFSRAADALAEYLAAYPNGRDREDASYLRAVALVRAGHSDEAADAAEEHLAAYPQSFHRKEASILIARVARQHKDCDKARRALAPWLTPPADPEAEATIRSCAN